jgi:hypothetical protein
MKKGFDKEHEDLTKIQIENSLELGWKSEDIMLVTDFPYEYGEVKSYVVTGDFNAADGNRSSKILVINQLFEDKVIDDLFWFHDHDAFQLEPMREPDLLGAVGGFTTEGWADSWNAGSFFFTKKAKDLFDKIYQTMMEGETNEQKALTYLWQNGLTETTILNNTYNMGIYHISEVYAKVDKPLIVAHFHPHKKRHLDLFKPFLPERLERIFNGYNIK